MNARRIHELMRAQFPAVDAANKQWINVADEQGGLLFERAQAAIVQPFLTRGIEEVLVEVHRKLGGRMALAELVEYLACHLGQGDIRIADRQFTTFAMLVRSGVSATWDAP